jgi:hypothetical protein
MGVMGRVVGSSSPASPICTPLLLPRGRQRRGGARGSPGLVAGEGEGWWAPQGQSRLFLCQLTVA